MSTTRLLGVFLARRRSTNTIDSRGFIRLGYNIGYSNAFRFNRRLTPVLLSIDLAIFIRVTIFY